RHYEVALEAIDRSCASWETLIQSGAGSEIVRYGYASSLDTRGLILKSLDRFADALKAYAKARQLAEALVRDYPADHRYGNELIRTLGNMSLCLSAMRRYDDASASLAAARAVIQTISDATPTLLETQRNVVWIESIAAQNLIGTGRDEDAIPALEQVRLAREVLLKANPTDIRHQQQLAWVLRTEAVCYQTLRKPERARPLALRALAVA